MNLLIKMGKQIAKHKFLILLIGFLLLIPSLIGMVTTRVNYDLLSYLPETLETVKGQDVMVDEYGMGAFAMVVVEDTDMKDIQKLADQFNKVDHVEKVLWYGDVADLSLPVEMIPSDLRKAFYNGDATLMLALFDNTTSSDEAMNAVGAAPFAGGLSLGPGADPPVHPPRNAGGGLRGRRGHRYGQRRTAEGRAGRRAHAGGVPRRHRSRRRAL